MDENKLSALKRCYPKFVQSLNTIEILDHLIGDEHISQDEFESISAKVTESDKARKFLEILSRKSNDAFTCFLSALTEKQPFLSKTLKEQLKKVPVKKIRQSSLTHFHEILLRGAVPDRPTAYINRPQTVAKLTDGFRWLGSKFRPCSTIARPDALLDADTSLHSDIPTNAWFLVYGPPGQGKSVTTAAVLRQNRQLLIDMFPGGVVWLRVGDRRGTEPVQQVLDVLSALIEHIDTLPPPSHHHGQHHSEHCGSSPSALRASKGGGGKSGRVDATKLTSLLHKMLISRQYRRAEFPSNSCSNNGSGGGVSPTALVLIVLDDVWDDCVVSALGSLPAAFVVTSRDMNILQRVLTPVRAECVEADMEVGEVASLLATSSGLPRDFLTAPCAAPGGVGSALAELPELCRGSPLAAALLGGLLASPTFVLGRYLGPRGFRTSTTAATASSSGAEDAIIDWTKVHLPSWYTYESLFASVSASLDRLTATELERYQQFVIFEDGCSLTEDVFEIYWACPSQEAVDTLQRLYRFSLVLCKGDSESGRHFFSVPNIQLDLLRTTVPLRRQQMYHCQLVDNYKARFGGQWTQLADFKLIHTYFCRSVGEHMLKAGRLNGLVDLLTDLQFICARLLVLGSSAVLADFRRYRPVFQRVERITDWYIYLHFLQTTAYQLINPDRLVREMHRRARSPTRPGSLCDMSGTSGSTSVGPGSRHGGFMQQSMTPDAVAKGFGNNCHHLYHHTSPSPPAFRRGGVGDAVDRQKRCSVRRPRRDLMVKGLDLLQLGLMFPQDHAIFQQSLSILRAADFAALKANMPPPPRYYWYWSNSNSADSELVWATRTGKDRITAIAHEADYSSLPPPLRRRVSTSDDRSINRRFVGTSDGRIIILDVTSGYEVAIHQVHKPSVAVMAISLLPGNQFCISCGADGRMIVSNLPPLDACIKSPSIGGGSVYNRSSLINDGGGIDDSYFTTIDVDDADDADFDEDTFLDVSSGVRGTDSSAFASPSGLLSPASAMMADTGSAGDSKTVLTNNQEQEGQRSSSPVLQEDEFPTYTVAPTVLADLPSSFEIRRNTQVAGSLFNRQTTDSNSTDAQQCIALSPLGTCLLFSDAPETHTGGGEMTLQRSQASSSADGAPPPVEQKSLPLSVYSILAQSQGKFTLVKSRELTLPPQKGDRSAQVTVATASISLDDSFIMVGLSNGRIWIFSLDEIGWVACIATSIPLKASPLNSALMSARTPRAGNEVSPLDTSSGYGDPRLSDHALVDGKVAKACIFIHWPNQSRIPVQPGCWVPPPDPLVAAAVDNFVLVWAFQNRLPDDMEDLQDPEKLVATSRAQFCLPSSPSATITTLDSQPFGNSCLIAAALTNGRASIWSLPERMKIFDVCAHCTPVTSVRLSPYGFCRSPVATPTASPPTPLGHRTHASTPGGTAVASDLVAVTTAAEDGVVKAWEFPWPVPKEPQSTNLSPILSGDSSPARQRSGSSGANLLEQSVKVVAFVREQPFPLWADVYGVIFGARGEFYAIGRIKASCSLQIFFRAPPRTVSPGAYSQQPQDFRCVEISITTSHRRRPAQHQLLLSSVAGSGAESKTSAFQAVSRIVKHCPVPSSAAFSDDMRLLVVGFENGTIQILHMNCPKDPLGGFRPYRTLSFTSAVCNGNGVTTRSGVCTGGWGSNGRPASRDLPLDLVPMATKVTHISLWTPPSGLVNEADLELIVAAATAGGTIHVWEIRRLKTRESSDCDGETIAEIKVPPSHQWQRVHLSTPYAAPSSTTSLPFLPSDADASVPTAAAGDQPSLIWFRLLPNLEPLRQQQNGDSNSWRGGMGWLSAGRDGTVCGRSLAPMGDDADSAGEWQFKIVAHKAGEIADVDVDPEGKWLATAGTDGAVCVWCLVTERKVFEGSHKPVAVRCVKFRPLVNPTEMGTEMLLASGDAAGNLRVWRLTAPRGGIGSMIASRSAISSEAAGCGGSGFVSLSWSADGGTLAGLSDRLCSWRLVTRTGAGAASHSSVGLGPAAPPQLHVLDRSRVVRVFDTTDRRNRLFISPGPSPPPATLLVFEVHSGICFVFDPIDMLPSTVASAMATSPPRPDVAYLLNRP